MSNLLLLKFTGNGWSLILILEPPPDKKNPKPFDPLAEAQKLLSTSLPILNHDSDRCGICREKRKLFLDYGLPICRRCLNYFGPSYY